MHEELEEPTGKEPLAVDLFHGKYEGAITSWKHTDGGKIPVIRLTGKGWWRSFLPMLNKTVEFPYPLKPKNIIDSDNANKVYLKPTPDIHDLRYRETEWADLSDHDQDRIRDLEEERDGLRNKVGKLRKQIRQLRDEREEEEAHDSQSRGTERVKCPKCDNQYAESTWRSNNGVCPNEKCDHLMRRMVD